MNLNVKNKEKFQTNSVLHKMNTRNKCHLHRPTTNLSSFQKRIHYAGSKYPNIYHVDPQV